MLASQNAQLIIVLASVGENVMVVQRYYAVTVQVGELGGCLGRQARTQPLQHTLSSEHLILAAAATVE